MRRGRIDMKSLKDVIFKIFLEKILEVDDHVGDKKEDEKRFPGIDQSYDIKYVFVSEDGPI
jgi:hypothetical protein